MIEKFVRKRDDMVAVSFDSPEICALGGVSELCDFLRTLGLVCINTGEDSHGIRVAVHCRGYVTVASVTPGDVLVFTRRPSEDGRSFDVRWDVVRPPESRGPAWAFPDGMRDFVRSFRAERVIEIMLERRGLHVYMSGF